MEGHPVVRKLETDMHDVVSSWLARDHPIPEHWKPLTDPISAMPYSKLRDLGVKGCTDLACQTRDTAMRLEALSRTFHDLSGAIYTEYRLALDNFVAVSNMASLITLPNETLSRILEFVVNGDEESPVRARRDAAVTLSHVCKYFRDTALSCAELWTNINGNSDLAALCLSRSKNVPLDLDVIIGYSQRGYPETYHFAFDKLLQEALNHSSRWRSLKIQYVLGEGFDDSDTNVIRGPEITEAFRGLDAPSLESLSIEGNSSLLCAFTIYTELEGWKAPGLRFATFEHYFPLHLPALENVTNLILSHRPGQIPLDELVKDLSRMTSLEELSLTAYGGAFPNPDAYPKERTYLPSVKALKIYAHHAGIPFGMMSPTRALFSSLFFPELEDLNVTLHGQFRKKYDGAGFEDLSMAENIAFIFQHVEQYPLVRNLRLNVMGEGEDGSGIGPTKFFQEGCISLVVPLFMLPNLKDLSIFSNSRLSFPKEDDKHFYDFEHLGIHWPTEGFDTMIPSLSTININIVEERAWKLPVVTFVGEILEKQKERGELGPCFFLVVHDDTYRFKGNGMRAGKYANQPAAQSYRGEDALEWCQEQHPHCTCGMQEMFLRQLSIFGHNHVNHT